MNLPKNKFFVFGLFLSAVLSCSTYRPSEPQVLFQADVADSIPYRIPSLTIMLNGDILALADYRICGSDIGFGRVDIHGRVFPRWWQVMG